MGPAGQPCLSWTQFFPLLDKTTAAQFSYSKGRKFLLWHRMEPNGVGGD